MPPTNETERPIIGVRVQVIKARLCGPYTSRAPVHLVLPSPPRKTSNLLLETNRLSTSRRLQRNSFPTASRRTKYQARWKPSWPSSTPDGHACGCSSMTAAGSFGTLHGRGGYFCWLTSPSISRSSDHNITNPRGDYFNALQHHPHCMFYRPTFSVYRPSNFISGSYVCGWH